jgi:hypothetical protein
MNSPEVLTCQSENPKCHNTYGIEDSDAETPSRYCSHECERNDNYDGGEPDGEDMFRDYQAELRYDAEEARKLK